MRANVAQIHWHSGSPVFSASLFQPRTPAPAPGPAAVREETEDSSTSCTKLRLATAGGDSLVRIWSVVVPRKNASSSGLASSEASSSTQDPSVQFRATLVRHAGVVNCVRFQHHEPILASGSDGEDSVDSFLGTLKHCYGLIFLWKESESSSAKRSLDEDNDENLETWVSFNQLRFPGVQEIYDICWSPDDKFLIAGSLDNSARIWDATTYKCLYTITEHSHYVQGVNWDPMGKWLATQSSDRSVAVFEWNPTRKSARLRHRHRRLEINTPEDASNSAPLSPKLSMLSSSSSSASSASSSSSSSSSSASSSCSSSSSSSSSKESSSKELSLPSSSSASQVSASSASVPAQIKALSSEPILVSEIEQASESSAIDESKKSAFHESASPSAPTSNKKSFSLFHDENLNSFFRRLAFSPGGEVLVTTAGIAFDDSIDSNALYIFQRRDGFRHPVVCLPGHKKPPVCVSFNPNRYQLREECDPWLAMRYRYYFAVATTNAVVIYDTQHIDPVAVVSNMHFASLTDINWAQDGSCLVVTSLDGFCSFISFSENELGEIALVPSVISAKMEEAAEALVSKDLDNILPPTGSSTTSEENAASSKDDKEPDTGASEPTPSKTSKKTSRRIVPTLITAFTSPGKLKPSSIEVSNNSNPVVIESPPDSAKDVMVPAPASMQPADALQIVAKDESEGNESIASSSLLSSSQPSSDLSSCESVQDPSKTIMTNAASPRFYVDIQSSPSAVVAVESMNAIVSIDSRAMLTANTNTNMDLTETSTANTATSHLKRELDEESKSEPVMKKPRRVVPTLISSL